MVLLELGFRIAAPSPARKSHASIYSFNMPTMDFAPAMFRILTSSWILDRCFVSIGKRIH
jgi:hypothetical protein